MAVILQMTYMKKLGLPNFSSHSCSVSLTVEIPDVSIAAQESTKLYQLLQASVDAQIQEVGFMPDATTYGMINGNNGNAPQSNGNGHSSRQNPNTHQRTVQRTDNGEAWNCTDGQRGLILRIINENQLDKNEVEGMAQQLFGVGVKALDKLQASQMIEELFEKVGRPQQRSRWRGQPQRPPVAP
jgi:hypothetical protein